VKSIHLLCNAHLDPVWLWEWEEGAAEAVNTFRTAADLCEEFPGFIFNHNEVVLYRWVREYEPELFRRIQRLVRAGRWHIMGGWYLQPDCNLPSGEAFVRQILLGREFFKRHFGVAPTTAINFDPFGHSRGLVQIMRQSGYDSYLFCRPQQDTCQLPENTFEWEGYDGSRLLAVRIPFYCSPLGKAREKVEKHISGPESAGCSILPWGVGNHGGGPSRKDLRDLAALIKSRPDLALRHSTPEAFVRELRRRRIRPFPVVRKSLNPWAVGCYTSQIRIKQEHRRLENELFATEKMAAAAWLTQGLAYPAAALNEVMPDLAFSEFHDSLPGSSIQPVEESILRLIRHAREELARIKARSFFALAGGQPKAAPGRIPILVYNPHPYPVKALVECEFQLPDQHWQDEFTQIEVRAGGRSLPSQVEKEVSNLNLDWRKHVVFAADLAPGQMNRFDCATKVIPRRPPLSLQVRGGAIRFKTAELEVVINARTGLLERYVAGGASLVQPGACRPLVLKDYPDPWGMLVSKFRRPAGAFRLLDPKTGARFSGVPAPLPSVRVIEDGPVRAVVEAVLGYGASFLCLRYKLPRRGTEIEIECRVFWNEKDRMLKLAIPTPDSAGVCRGQVAFGVEEFAADGCEKIAQQWAAVLSNKGRTALTCINDGTYGLDFLRGELRLSLLRSSAYSGHPIGKRPIVPTDRFTPRIDQGERLYRFWLNGGPTAGRLAAVTREAQAKHEGPMTLSFFPSGLGRRAAPLALLDDSAVQLVAVKKAERGQALILRLFETTGRARAVTLIVPVLKLKKKLALHGFEVKTFRLEPRQRIWTETDLMEKPLI
jgi:alpha-mannosidase